MYRLAIASLLPVALVACPKKQPITAQTGQAGAGCPSGAGVYVASFVTQQPNKGRSGWVVPLHAVKLESGASVPDYASIDAATAQAAGVPAPPTGAVWLATASGTPCRAKVGSYYAAKIEGSPAEASLSYGFELDGCLAPQDAAEAGGIALVSEDVPTGCRFEVPQPGAVRLGTMDDKKQWQPPASEKPIPPQLASMIPEKSCTPPACEKLWAFAGVNVGGKTVAWTGAVNWLQIGPPAQQCTWTAERFSGIFIPSAAGATKVTEGQQHPLVLSAVLADGAGAKVLLAEGPGEYATYDLGPSGATLARSTTWMFAPDDAWQAIDYLGPICEPSAGP